MFVQFLYNGELLWLNVLSANDETFVGRVWNHPVNRGLMFGQKLQIKSMLFCTFYIKNKSLHINVMFARINKSKIEGNNMTSILYDNENKPVKTVNFGAAGYLDYTISPHNDERKKRNIKRHTKTGTTI